MGIGLGLFVALIEGAVIAFHRFGPRKEAGVADPISSQNVTDAMLRGIRWTGIFLISEFASALSSPSPRVCSLTSPVTRDGDYIVEMSVQFVVYVKGVCVAKDSVLLLLFQSVYYYYRSFRSWPPSFVTSFSTPNRLGRGHFMDTWCMLASRLVQIYD
jgi:hypothetical protein